MCASHPKRRKFSVVSCGSNEGSFFERYSSFFITDCQKSFLVGYWCVGSLGLPKVKRLENSRALEYHTLILLSLKEPLAKKFILFSPWLLKSPDSDREHPS